MAPAVACGSVSKCPYAAHSTSTMWCQVQNTAKALKPSLVHWHWANKTGQLLSSVSFAFGPKMSYAAGLFSAGTYFATTDLKL